MQHEFVSVVGTTMVRGANGYLMIDTKTGTVIQSQDPRIKMMVSIYSEPAMTSEMMPHGHHSTLVDKWMTFHQYVEMEMGWGVKMEEASAHWDTMVTSKNTRKEIDGITGNLEFVQYIPDKVRKPSAQQSGDGEGALGVSAGAPTRQGTEHIDDPPEEQSESEEEQSELEDFIRNIEEAMRRSISDQKTISELNPIIEVADSQEVDGDSQTLPSDSGRRGSASSSAAAGSSSLAPAAGPEPALKRTKTAIASRTQLRHAL